MTRLRHYDDSNTARYVTFSTYRRLPSLANETRIRIFLKCLAETRDKQGFRLLAYVAMPEHVHLVLHLPKRTKLGLLIREIKSRSARAIFGQEPQAVGISKRVCWERRCYDHNCRTETAVLEKITYCHNNPVKRGLVSSPGEWPWSSWGCYHGVEDVPLVVDVEDWYVSAVKF